MGVPASRAVRAMVSPILGPSGEALPSPVVRRARALNGGWQGTPYDAADVTGQHLQSWLPMLISMIWRARAERGVSQIFHIG